MHLHWLISEVGSNFVVTLQIEMCSPQKMIGKNHGATAAQTNAILPLAEKTIKREYLVLSLSLISFAIHITIGKNKKQ